MLKVWKNHLCCQWLIWLRLSFRKWHGLYFLHLNMHLLVVLSNGNSMVFAENILKIIMFFLHILGKTKYLYTYLYNFCQSINCWLIIFVHHEILHFSQCLLQRFNTCVQSEKSIWKNVGKLTFLPILNGMFLSNS